MSGVKNGVFGCTLESVLIALAVFGVVEKVLCIILFERSSVQFLEFVPELNFMISIYAIWAF